MALLLQRNRSPELPISLPDREGCRGDRRAGREQPVVLVDLRRAALPAPRLQDDTKTERI